MGKAVISYTSASSSLSFEQIYFVLATDDPSWSIFTLKLNFESTLKYCIEAVRLAGKAFQKSPHPTCVMSRKITQKIAHESRITDFEVCEWRTHQFYVIALQHERRKNEKSTAAWQHLQSCREQQSHQQTIERKLAEIQRILIRRPKINVLRQERDCRHSTRTHMV